MSIASTAFDAAVVATNVAHGAARVTTAVAGETKVVGKSFWAGVRYAHATNKATGTAAARLDAPAAQPQAALLDAAAMLRAAQGIEVQMPV